MVQFHGKSVSVYKKYGLMSSLFYLNFLGLGNQHKPCHGSRILQGEAHELGRIDDTGL
jgi:hypothetical protein